MPLFFLRLQTDTHRRSSLMITFTTRRKRKSEYWEDRNGESENALFFSQRHSNQKERMEKTMTQREKAEKSSRKEEEWPEVPDLHDLTFLPLFFSRVRNQRKEGQKRRRGRLETVSLSSFHRLEETCVWLKCKTLTFSFSSHRVHVISCCAFIMIMTCISLPAAFLADECSPSHRGDDRTEQEEYDSEREREKRKRRSAFEIQINRWRRMLRCERASRELHL